MSTWAKAWRVTFKKSIPSSRQQLRKNHFSGNDFASDRPEQHNPLAGGQCSLLGRGPPQIGIREFRCARSACQEELAKLQNSSTTTGSEAAEAALHTWSESPKSPDELNAHDRTRNRGPAFGDIFLPSVPHLLLQGLLQFRLLRFFPKLQDLLQALLHALVVVFDDACGKSTCTSQHQLVGFSKSLQFAARLRGRN